MQPAVTRIDDNILLIVYYSLQLLGRNTKNSGNLVRSRLEVPDVGNRNSQGNMSHPLPSYLLLGNFHTAPVADDSTITDSLVLAAIAFVVLGRTENLLAEKAVALRLVGPVVHRLRLQDLSMGSVDNVLRRCKRDADSLEVAPYLIIFVIESRHIISIQIDGN